MEFEKEMTAPNVSVGADTEQSSQTFTDHSLTDFDSDSRDLTMISTGKCKEEWTRTIWKRYR